MTKWFGAVLLAVALTLSGSVHGAAVAASAVAGQAQAKHASDVSFRRHRHRNHDARRPSYYGRPTYYAPAPLDEIPPFFGLVGSPGDPAQKPSSRSEQTVNQQLGNHRTVCEASDDHVARSFMPRSVRCR